MVQHMWHDEVPHNLRLRGGREPQEDLDRSIIHTAVWQIRNVTDIVSVASLQNQSGGSSAVSLFPAFCSPFHASLMVWRKFVSKFVLVADLHPANGTRPCTDGSRWRWTQEESASRLGVRAHARGHCV